MELGKALPWVLLALTLTYVYDKTDHFRSLTHPPESSQPVTVIQSTPERHGNGDTSALQGPVSYATAVESAAPAVVNIFTTQVVQSSNNPWANDPMLRRFFGGNPEGQKRASLGSGVIVSTDGYILTNNHVVASADAIVVALRDGRRVKARIVGVDPDSDLAVIKIDLNNLPALPFKTTPAHVGDVVLAIGDPFGVGQTVTQGIVSAQGRQGLGLNTYEDFIQTDAAINPGNSGGALIDVYGNLVGINSAIYSRSGGSMGIGFAIPVSLAKDVMTSIIEHGKVVRGWLGIEVRGPEQTPEQALVTTDTTEPVIVGNVVQNGPAGQAGILPGDQIISVNGEKPSGPNQVVSRVASLKPGTEAHITVSRNGQQIDTTVRIGERPPQPQREPEQQFPMDGQ